ncbi:MAG: carboxypeptidase-like regulatory domain-containing protein [Tannerellaceae bacterium]|nr:carboxypeptidase-like regulatory domain-containing protein [Tannerellaceae bacterium]
MRRKILATMLLCSVALGSFTQNLQIKGKVRDASGQEEIEFANIVLQTPDSMFVAGTTSDLRGTFSLTNLAAGDYLLVVSNLGYTSETILLESFAANLVLDDILLQDASVALEGVTVTASGMTSRADRKIVFPSQRQLEASTNGINLLQQLMLPKLQVNPLFNTVSLPGGGEVQLRINGVKVEEADIISLNPADVLRVEYHDNPGLRYDNAEVVINFIVRRPETGGTIHAEGSQGVNTMWGNYNASVKVNHKKSEFGINAYGSVRDFYEMWRDNEEVFNFANGDVLRRIEEGEPGRTQMNWEGINANYSYQEPDKYLFNATFRMNFNNQPRYDYIGNLYNMANREDFVYVVDKSSQKYKTPALDLYYQHSLKNDQTLVFNVVGTYNYSNTHRIYTETKAGQLLTGVNNGVTGRKYSIIGEAIYEKKLGDYRVSAGLKHTQAFSNNEYRNGHTYDVDMTQADTYVYGEFKGKVQKLDYTLGVGVSRYWYHQEGEGDAYRYYNFRPRLTMQYNLPGNSFIRLNANMDNSSPSLSYLTAVDQVVDSLQIQRGNPNLKPYTRYGVGLTYEVQHKKFYGNLWGSYEYAHKPVMDEKLTEGDKFIQTWDNQKNWQRLASRATVRVGPLKDILQVSVTGGVNHYLSNDNTYAHRYTNWFYSTSLSATYKKFVLGYEIQSNWNWFWGENLSGGENIQVMFLKYNHKNLSVGGGVFNPFIDNYKVESENWSQHASYKKKMYINESSRMFMVQLSYNFSFGRSYSSGNKKLHNADSDSGVMSTGK